MIFLTDSSSKPDHLLSAQPSFTNSSLRDTSLNLTVDPSRSHDHDQLTLDDVSEGESMASARREEPAPAVLLTAAAVVKPTVYGAATGNY